MIAPAAALLGLAFFWACVAHLQRTEASLVALEETARTLKAQFARQRPQAETVSAKGTPTVREAPTGPGPKLSTQAIREAFGLNAPPPGELFYKNPPLLHAYGEGMRARFELMYGAYVKNAKLTEAECQEFFGILEARERTWASLQAMQHSDDPTEKMGIGQVRMLDDSASDARDAALLRLLGAERYREYNGFREQIDLRHGVGEMALMLQTVDPISTSQIEGLASLLSTTTLFSIQKEHIDQAIVDSVRSSVRSILTDGQMEAFDILVRARIASKAPRE